MMWRDSVALEKQRGECEMQVKEQGEKMPSDVSPVQADVSASSQPMIQSFS